MMGKIIQKLFFVFIMYISLSRSSSVPRIAVIGGGLGGASVVHFLEELFGQDGAQIDVYEEHSKVGGRLATVMFDNYEYEVGGSIIHSKNKYMHNFVKLLGLKKRQGVEMSKCGFFNGKEFVFAERSGWSIINIAKLWWRYGYQLFFLRSYIDTMLSHFDRIYGLQTDGNTYTTVPDLLKAMDPDFVSYLQISVKDGFQESGFSHRIVDEIIKGTLSVNYGQSTDVHKFVGSVSVAGAASGNLWSVHGGNRLVPQKLLDKSNAKLIKAKVLNITLPPEMKYAVYFYNYVAEAKSEYDIIILATPLAQNTLTKIEFVNFPSKLSFPGKYHRTVCTIVSGTLNSTYFGFDDESDTLDEIFSLNEELFFNSVGKIFPVNYNDDMKDIPNVWKIFSKNPLTEQQLNTLFTEKRNVKVIDWLAYPHYSHKLRTDSFILHKNLYHLNAIEWAASAMEMSVVAAKNVALLAFQNWNSDFSEYSGKTMKEEL